MWRHGDVLIQACKKIPDSAQLLPHLILARGEITGHAHRIRERDGVELFNAGDEMFLRVSAKIATIIHEEHAPIELSQGIYRVWIQREYTPKEIRRVLD
jgi:hypothetical protein